MFSERVRDVLKGKPDSAASVVLAADAGLCRIVPVEESPDIRIHTASGSFGVVNTKDGRKELQRPAQ